MGSSSAKRPRVSIDVQADTRRRLRLAAAKRDMSVARYILEAVESRLLEDLGEDEGAPLSAKSDPVLAELWDNPRDAAYDQA